MVILHRFIVDKSDSRFHRLENRDIPLTAGINGFRTGVTAHRPPGHAPWVLGTASPPSLEQTVGGAR